MVITPHPLLVKDGFIRIGGMYDSGYDLKLTVKRYGDLGVDDIFSLL